MWAGCLGVVCFLSEGGSRRFRSRPDGIQSASARGPRPCLTPLPTLSRLHHHERCAGAPRSRSFFLLFLEDDAVVVFFVCCFTTWPLASCPPRIFATHTTHTAHRVLLCTVLLLTSSMSSERHHMAASSLQRPLLAAAPGESSAVIRELRCVLHAVIRGIHVHR